MRVISLVGQLSSAESLARGESVTITVTVKTLGVAQDVSDYDYFRLDIGVLSPRTVILSKRTDAVGEGEIDGDETGVVRFFLTTDDTLLLAAPEYVAQVWGKKDDETPFIRWPEASFKLCMLDTLDGPPT
jgi:hypothetical protein